MPITKVCEQGQVAESQSVLMPIQNEYAEAQQAVDHAHHE
jgi:hypothetical protein